MDRNQVPEIMKILAELFATPKGQQVAKDFNTARNAGSAIVEDVAMTPVRVSDFVSRSIDAGGFENMDPAEVGRAATEAGALPLVGAVGGGAPRNAAGMVVQHEGADPRKYAAAGAGVAGAGTVANDVYEGEFPGFSQDYITDVLGPNMLYGAGAGFGLGLGALGIGAIDDSLTRAKKIRGVRDTERWARERMDRHYAETGTTPARPPTPAAPPAPGAGRPQTSGPGSSQPPQPSGPGGTSAPPPAGPRKAPPSGAPVRSQGAGNQTSSATSGAPGEYDRMHTIGARAYLSNLFDPSNARGATPAQIASELVPYFKLLRREVTPDTRSRAAKTLEILATKLPKNLSEVDAATLKNAIAEATGKVGTLGLAGAAVTSDDLEAMLAEIMGGGK